MTMMTIAFLCLSVPYLAHAELPPLLICENIDEVENLDEPTGVPDNSVERDLTHTKSNNRGNYVLLRVSAVYM